MVPRGRNHVLACHAYRDYQERLAVYREENYSYARSGTTREREAERIYQERMRIHHQWVAEQTQVAAERDSLLLYHTATQTADVLSDPSTATHMVLDVVGMIPAVGEAADLLNAAIYAAEGNHLDAGLSLAGAIPFAGAAVAVARTARNIGKAVDAAVTASRLQDTFRVVDAIPTRAATPPTPDLTAPRVPDTPGTAPKPPEAQPATRTEPPHTSAAPAGSGDRTVFSGHGGIDAGDSRVTTIPEGTCLNFYCAHGETISDRLGNAIETGGAPAPLEVAHAGDVVPDYVLSPAEGLTIKGNPTTVDAPTRLSDLLEENMGVCDWAACRWVE